MLAPWARGARIAVLLTLDFDAESLWRARDPAPVNRPGPLSRGRYGARVGVPRLLDVLAREEVPAAFFIPGWVVEHRLARERDVAR